MRLIRSWWKNPRTRYGSLLATLVAVLLLPTHSIGEMAVAAARNAAGMLDARSPGGRDGGILVQTKIPPRHRGSAARTPSSRVLSETRSRPPGGIGGGPAAPDVPFGEAPLGGVGPSSGPDAFGREPGHFGDLPTGGGSLLLFDAPPETPGQETPVTVTPAVPEPGTYALLILGLGVIGAALRRRPRTVGARPATARDAVDGAMDGAARTLDA